MDLHSLLKAREHQSHILEREGQTTTKVLLPVTPRSFLLWEKRLIGKSLVLLCRSRSRDWCSRPNGNCAPRVDPRTKRTAPICLFYVRDSLGLLSRRAFRTNLLSQRRHCHPNSDRARRRRVKSTTSDGDISLSNLLVILAKSMLKRIPCSFTSPSGLYALRARS